MDENVKEILLSRMENGVNYHYISIGMGRFITRYDIPGYKNDTQIFITLKHDQKKSAAFDVFTPKEHDDACDNALSDYFGERIMYHSDKSVVPSQRTSSITSS